MVNPVLHARPLATSPWAKVTWLVIAPHADDEVLGCGALISEAAKERRIAAVAFLTDGAGSHPCGTDIDRRKLAALRRREAIAAIRMLGPSAPLPLFLDWPDAHPHPLQSEAFTATANRLAKICDRCGVDAIAVTRRDEPHRDHVAAFDVARETARRAVRHPRLFEYIVWAPRAPGRDFIAVKTAPIALGKRKRALAQHKSQMTPMLGDGFRVPTAMRDMPACDILYTPRWG